MSILIKNARVLDPTQNLDAVVQVLVKDGKIDQIGDVIQAPEAQVVDASGLWLMPGLVDIQVHLREPGQESKETIASGTRAAAAGGITSVVAMPNTIPALDNVAMVELIKTKGRDEGVINVFPSACVTKNRAGEELVEIGELKKAGVVMLTDDGGPVSNAELMRRALEYSDMFDLPIMQHCEDLDLSRDGVINEGEVSVRLGLRGYPKAAEAVMVARDIVLAETTGAHVHMFHLSGAQSIELMRQAKRLGRARVTCETAPHYFTLTDQWIEHNDYSTFGKMNPPLGSVVDREAVIEGIKDGTIDAIATDHAPHTSLDKNVVFDQAAFGIVGLETSLSLTMDQLVHPGIISPLRAVELLSSNPAKIIRQYSKGSLKPGMDADLTLVNPDEEWIVDSEKFYSNSRNTPFQGFKLKGRVKRTMVAGRWVYEDGIGIVV